jgi:SET domain-containing protein
MKTKTAAVKLDVKKSFAGLGLFAGEAIKKGSRIIEYIGEKVTADEANKRGGKYLFEINTKWTIDGTTRKNTARYINHACGSAANCEAENDRGHIFILAKKNIEAGAELVYDYGAEYFDEHIKPHGCRCGECSLKVTKEVIK